MTIEVVITVALYGPKWMPADIPMTMHEHVQNAVDCYDAA
ncbi:hypothetical protein AWB78_00604 [Caballeronia calidae]|uniref:Uncharacterized protein n=1 Tax=Caballeronia calidae TaxID=1777139 RepID=A0A157ZIM5_9BURK|nr:hypothetical protein AWB78_00604 [Caballeronia calidae]